MKDYQHQLLGIRNALLEGKHCLAFELLNTHIGNYVRDLEEEQRCKHNWKLTTTYAYCTVCKKMVTDYDEYQRIFNNYHGKIKHAKRKSSL